MGYHEIRYLEIRDAHATRIREFLSRYRPGRPTVVLLPGGMGSQLDRSDQRYRDDHPVPAFKYDPVWLDLGLLFDGDALTLELHRDGRDKGGHVIIPDGPLRFLVNAYDRTEAFFRQDSRYNYIVFGVDWRRAVGEAAAFLDEFLRHLRAAVKTRFRGEDPLARTSLLAHSMGGLVAKVFLHRPGPIPRAIARVITVATPLLWHRHPHAALLQRRGRAQHVARRAPGRAYHRHVARAIRPHVPRSCHLAA